MILAKEGALAGQILLRRSTGACARSLSLLARDHRLAFRRLSAAYFLITGRRYCPKCAAPCLPASLALALRQQFGWEQRWEQQNCQAVQATQDPCLKELYLELAEQPRSPRRLHPLSFGTDGLTGGPFWGRLRKTLPGAERGAP